MTRIGGATFAWVVMESPQEETGGSRSQAPKGTGESITGGGEHTWNGRGAE